jgi:hypothetical protein
MKFGRNDPCPCGSNKKFKKCCMDRKYNKFGKPIPPPEVLEAARKFINLPKEPFEKGGFLTGRPFIDTVGNGHRFRAVGSRVYRRPINEMFHEFILSIFAEALDRNWLIQEERKSEKNQHLILQWYREIDNKIKEHKDPMLPEDYLFSIKQSGNIRSLLASAYDYYSLFHCNARILPKLLNRLKNKDNFQGAKYEIAVGGLAVRAGFDIKWINLKEKHCEFIGTHKITKDTVAFEAKSHHREGVLGRAGNNFNPESARVKIMDHIKESLGQFNKDIPLVIFDDLNLPITPDADLAQKRWFKEVDGSLIKFGFLKNYKNTNFGALFTTNFSWHFHENLDNLKKNEVMAIFHTGGNYSLNPKTIHFLKIAAEQYGFVPAKLEERQQDK